MRALATPPFHASVFIPATTQRKKNHTMLWLITAINPDCSSRQWAQIIDADAAHVARAIAVAASTDPFCKRNTEYEAQPL